MAKRFGAVFKGPVVMGGLMHTDNPSLVTTQSGTSTFSSMFNLRGAVFHGPVVQGGSVVQTNVCQPDGTVISTTWINAKVTPHPVPIEFDDSLEPTNHDNFRPLFREYFSHPGLIPKILALWKEVDGFSTDFYYALVNRGDCVDEFMSRLDASSVLRRQLFQLMLAYDLSPEGISQQTFKQLAFASSRDYLAQIKTSKTYAAGSC